MATTFRSVPDPTIRESNDTVLRVLNLKLEASCTTSASTGSSRLFLVESTTRDELLGGAKRISKWETSTTSDISYFRRAVDNFEARRRLSRFRRYHSYLQEEDEVGTTLKDIEGQSRSLDLAKPDVLVCTLYLSVWLFNLLAHQRLSDKATKSLRDGLLERSQHGSLFVFSHLCTYYLFGFKTLYSSRVAGLVSLYSLAEFAI